MLVICGVLALGLLVIFFWKKSAVAAYGASGLWVLLGFVAMGLSSSPVFPIEDTYMGLFWMGIAFCIACVLLPSVMREKPSKDDIYPEEVDEVTGDPVSKEVPKQKKRRSSRFFDRSGQL